MYFKTLGQYDCQINVMQCLLVVVVFLNLLISHSLCVCLLRGFLNERVFL